MNWTQLLSTIFGAVIGITSTMLADWIRNTRDRREGDRTLKREMYGNYLAALSLTRHNLRAAARNPLTAEEEKTRTAIAAFSESKVYETRYQVALVAPASVVEASTSAFNCLRRIRDLVEAGGGTHGDPQYRTAQDEWASRFAELRQCMRTDLEKRSNRPATAIQIPFVR